MALLIMIMPIVLAIGITFFAPGLNDTTINLALLKNDDSTHIEYMENFAKIEMFDSKADIIGSVANYFKRHGWRAGERVTLKVNLGTSTGTDLGPLVDVGAVELPGFRSLDPNLPGNRERADSF